MKFCGGGLYRPKALRPDYIQKNNRPENIQKTISQSYIYGMFLYRFGLIDVSKTDRKVKAARQMRKEGRIIEKLKTKFFKETKDGLK